MVADFKIENHKGDDRSALKISIPKLNLVVHKFDTNCSGASIASDTAEHLQKKVN